ncbi:MAG TPA: CDGSH iron-sulfur domain-containing protein [Bryobacteraceae bacterium]|jgi:CDGSH-type Zn-finger protein|nr:CDGSH iron-sulfur domain-containing protein [Bryobacteraceae bacterium]
MSAKITINNNGSIRIEGEFSIHDQEGKQFDLAGRTTIGLCRCGQSQNKPFCDGSHRTSGFESLCPARELPPPAPKI